MIKNILSGFFISLFLTSCGVKRTEEIKKINSKTQENESQKPISVDSFTENCDENSVNDINTIELFLFQRGETNYFTKKINSSTFYSSDVISSFEYKTEIEQIIDGDQVKNILLVPPRKFSLCPSLKKAYPQSIQSTALNIKYFTQITNQKFHEVTKIKIPSVKINLLPKVKRKLITSGVSTSVYLTDNAFYQPFSSQITFLPHSLERKENGLFMNFWEIPIVPSHEYAHHIFKTLFPYQNLTDQKHQDFCFHHNMIENDKNTENNQRKISVEDVLDSVNEAFADLIANYTLNEEEKDLSGIPCLEISRDITKGHFSNGMVKMFGQEVINNFFFEKEIRVRNNCENVNFQTSHAIGAIWAYNINQFLSLFTDSQDKKIRILTTWIYLIRKFHPTNKLLPPKRYFDEIFSIFLRLTIIHFDRTFDRTICNEIELMYPTFYQKFGECSSF